MIYLPNDCYCSKLSVYPKDWKKVSANAMIPWKIFYRFYDPKITKDGKPYPKQVHLKGMNRFTNLKQKRKITQLLMDQELAMLNTGYNPIEKKIISQSNFWQDCRTYTIIQAFWFGYEKINAEPNTMRDIRCILKNCEKAIKQLGWEYTCIREVECSHIKYLLDACGSVVNKWTNNNYNTYRKYLGIVCKELVQYGALKYNPVRDIALKKVLRKKRLTLTSEQMNIVYEHLHKTSYFFWRFMVIFFYSGGRETELLSIKKEDVFIETYQYRVIVKKGREFREVYKTINANAYEMWQEILNESKPGEYIFSKLLKPGPNKINAHQITRRWYVHVKQKLSIAADFYSLKHSYTEKVSETLSAEDAARMNSHTSTAMVINIYDTGREKRQHEKLKNIDIKFK